MYLLRELIYLGVSIFLLIFGFFLNWVWFGLVVGLSLCEERGVESVRVFFYVSIWVVLFDFLFFIFKNRCGIG